MFCCGGQSWSPINRNPDGQRQVMKKPSPDNVRAILPTWEPESPSSARDVPDPQHPTPQHRGVIMTPLFILIMLMAPATALAQGIECRVIQVDPAELQPFTSATQTVGCPEGLVLTGGGAQCGLFPETEGLNMTATTYPEGDPASWKCIWANNTDERASCQCDAICCTMSSGPEPLPLVCEHDECVTGGPLEVGCDDCVDAVCACDSYCCATNWDTFCVHEAQELCGKSCNSTNTCLASCGCP